MALNQGRKDAQAQNSLAGKLRKHLVPEPTDKRGQEGQDLVIQAFIERLQEEERMLILLQRELYEGSWGAMLSDLKNRLEGRPYIFKLANRIRDDIARIEKLQAFEQEHNISLADYVKPPANSGETV